MRHYHPNWRSAMLVAGVLLLFGSGGCRSQQSPLANPFLAPDRVPPPATRSLAPGTAQPYYPGDPLPAMQGMVTPPAAALTVAPATFIPPADSVIAPTIHAEQAVAAAGENPVAIPSDSNELRFALATPPPAQVVPSAPAVFGPPVQLAAVPATQSVQPATYTSPAIPADNFPAVSTDPAQLGPWRSPQVASAPVSPAPMSVPIAATPARPMIVATAQAGMSVQLRPVTSPAPELSPTPRIRLPGYASSFQQPSISTGPVQQAAYVAPASGGTLQTVQITALPATPNAGFGPAPGVASQPTYVASVSSDGFRARGSTQ